MLMLGTIPRVLIFIVDVLFNLEMKCNDKDSHCLHEIVSHVGDVIHMESIQINEWGEEGEGEREEGNLFWYRVK